MKDNKGLAYLYIRFSTKKQEQGDSLRRQIEVAEKWCSENNIELSAQTYEDLGVSAFKEGGKRPALEDLIAAIRMGKIVRGSYLLIEDHDRLSRRGWRHTQELVHQLVLSGVRLVMLKDGKVYDSSNIDNIFDNIMLMLSAERAQEESERKSRLIKASREKARRDKKVTGKLPAWISRDGDGFTFNDKKATIQELINCKLAGKSHQSTAKHLNSLKMTTGNDSAWSASGVRAIIQNHALYGAKAYFDTGKDGRMNKEPIEIVSDIFPALITHEQYQVLNTRQQAGRTSKRGAYSRLLKCGACGGAMTTRTSNYKGKPRAYKMCVRATEGSCNQIERIREPEVYLNQALHFLRYESSSTLYVSRTSEYQQRLETLNATVDLLTKNGNVDALARVYTDIKEVSDLIEESKAQDQNNVDVKVDFSLISNIENVEQRNIELRKVLCEIRFYCIEKVGQTSKWKVVIEQINGIKKYLVLDQQYGFGNTVVDYASLLTQGTEDNREPWEIEDSEECESYSY
ncbi:recombinase family protein [Vibrio splendidus]